MRLFLVTVLLAATVCAEEDSPREHAFKVWFNRIKADFAKDEISESRKVTVAGCQKHDTPSAVKWLILDVIAKDDAADVAREAVRVLGLFRNPKSKETMATVFTRQLKKDWATRALVLQAFAHVQFDEGQDPIAAALKDKDARVVQAACRAIGAGRKVAFKDDLLRLSKHKVPVVRGAAVLAFGEWTKLREKERQAPQAAKDTANAALPRIFQVFVTDASHRVRYDAWLALRQISFQRKLGTAPGDWEEWWREQSGAVPEGEPNPWGKSFPRGAKGSEHKPMWFGMPIGADRVAFVYDCSLRINNAFAVDIPAQRKLPKDQRIPNFFSVKTRWDLLRVYTNDCLKSMPDRVELGFVFFTDEVAVFPEATKLLKLSKKARSQIRTHLEEGVKRSATAAMFDGLEKGWGWLKEGDAKTNFAKGADTILFATCSRPTDGKHKNKSGRIADECWRISVTRGVRFFVAGIHNHDFALLQGLARDSNGLYVHVQPAGDTAEPQDLEFWPEKKKKFEAERKKRKRG